MAKFNHASDKLSTVTVHRRTIIQVDRSFFDVWIPLSVLMPPRFQTIHNKVGGFMRRSYPYNDV